MTATLPARVAEAWRKEAARYSVGRSFIGEWIVREDGNEVAPFNGGADIAACRAWVDEQCGRAAARVVVEAMGEPSEGVVEAGDAELGNPYRVRTKGVWLKMLAAFRREMGL